MLEHLTLLPQRQVSPLRAALDAFLLDREAMRCSAKTLEHYRYTLGGFVSYLEAQGVAGVAGITPAHVRGYLVALQRRGLKDATQHTHARGVKAWLRWLVREGDLASSPMERVSMPRLEQRIPPPYAPGEVRALLAACDRRTARGARDYAIILTLLDTGLRASELVSLRVGHVDMRTGLATIMGKGGKQRIVRAGAKARGAILRMLGARGDVGQGEPLFVTDTAEPHALTIHGLQTMLRRLGERAGVEPCAPHRFRRTFALWCLRDGMDLHSLRMLMGHSSLVVLQRYLALAGEDLERVHKQHSPADRLLGE
jgi:integrase/recombinase XerC/integrase/recombinase XerD